MKKNLAPIILFVYNRLEHTKQTVTALKKNTLAKESDLYIYSDGAKDKTINSDIVILRKYLKTIDGFKTITIIEREKNYGLAVNIIDGVNEIINQYDKVIVLEDDLITAPNFLCYLNNALEFYSTDNNIFSISGFTLPLKSLSTYKGDVYASYRPSSWGWATWKNRWENIDWEIKDYNNFISNKVEQRAFNKGGVDMTRMLKHYKEGKNNSWAIRWSYAMYKKNMLSIYPKASMVQNIGFGDQATHCKGINIYKTILSNTSNCDFIFKKDISPDKDLANDFKFQYSYTNKLIKKIVGFLK